jgi:hypothetical protein
MPARVTMIVTLLALANVPSEMPTPVAQPAMAAPLQDQRRAEHHRSVLPIALAIRSTGPQIHARSPVSLCLNAA